MRILAIGHRGTGKTSYFSYIRALFRNDGMYRSRVSPALETFWLPKGTDLLDFVVATSAVKEHTFELQYNPKGLNKKIGGRLGLYDFTFIDVPGGKYDDFLDAPKPNSNWDSGFSNYNALIIIVDGNSFVNTIKQHAYKVENLITCAANVARDKSIPAYIIITHADELDDTKIALVKEKIDLVVKGFSAQRLPNIPYVFVDVKPPDRQNLNSHALKTEKQKKGQLPFFSMLSDYMVALRNSKPKGNALLSLFVPSERERLSDAITDIQSIMRKI